MSRLQGSDLRSTLSLKHWGLLIVAGVASFLLPFLIQGGGSSDDDVVTAMPRDLRLKAVRTVNGNAQANRSPESMPLTDTDQTSRVRMNRVVVRDPFGPLIPETVALAVAPSAAPPPPIQRKPVVKVVAPAGPPAPPPAPVAPPLPFTAIGFIQGQRIGDGQQQTFIQQGEKLTIIRQGDTINNTYRVDAISAERVVVTYLPLGQKQTLPLLDNLK